MIMIAFNVVSVKSDSTSTNPLYQLDTMHEHVAYEH